MILLTKGDIGLQILYIVLDINVPNEIPTK